MAPPVDLFYKSRSGSASVSRSASGSACKAEFTEVEVQVQVEVEVLRRPIHCSVKIKQEDPFENADNISWDICTYRARYLLVLRVGKDEIF